MEAGDMVHSLEQVCRLMCEGEGGERVRGREGGPHVRLDLIGDGTEEAVCLVEEGVDRLRVQGLVGAPGRQCVGVG